MDNYWESIFSYANVPPDHPFLPNIPKPVHILGKRFIAVTNNEEIRERLQSLYWMTYRKCFSPIGTTTGPTTDAGWGCMHRCSQMMLAEAIIRVKLGADWRWTSGCTTEEYLKVCSLFQDCDSALYSIQNISQTGVSVGKPIRSWFGPNTAVQVIKKLTAYDQWTNWAVHITIEDGVIVDEIRTLCRRKVHTSIDPLKPLGGCQPDTHRDEERAIGLSNGFDAPSRSSVDGDHQPVVTNEFEQLSSSPVKSTVVIGVPTTSDNGLGHHLAGNNAPTFHLDPELVGSQLHTTDPVMRDLEQDFLEVVIPPTFEQTVTADSDGNLEPQKKAVADAGDSLMNTDFTSTSNNSEVASWRPLLLFIPLRLGLQTANPCYFEAIKGSLRIPQSIGILGGRPGHAFWIVGVVGEDDVLCLDPHEVHPASPEGVLTPEDDASHHCSRPNLIPLTRLDPSLVIGFVCSTEQDFSDLCDALSEQLLSPEASGGRPLFELHPTRPHNLPPVPSFTAACLADGSQHMAASGLGMVSTSDDSTDEAASSTAPNHAPQSCSDTSNGGTSQLIAGLRQAGSQLTTGLKMLTTNVDQWKSLCRRVVSDTAPSTHELSNHHRDHHSEAVVLNNAQHRRNLQLL